VKNDGVKIEKKRYKPEADVHIRYFASAKNLETGFGDKSSEKQAGAFSNSLFFGLYRLNLTRKILF
jgi:hypothetical protein